MITVIRIIKMEGAEQDVRRVLAHSLPDGIHEKNVTLTVATHFSDLPPEPLVVIDNEELHATLRGVTKE